MNVLNVCVCVGIFALVKTIKLYGPRLVRYKTIRICIQIEETRVSTHFAVRLTFLVRSYQLKFMLFVILRAIRT